MIAPHRWIFVALLLSACIEPAFGDGPSSTQLTAQVRQLFSDRCYICHGPDENARATDMRLDREDAVDFETSSGKLFAVSGNLEESEVWARIQSDDPDYVMPPPSSKIDLTAAQKNLIRQWIEQGAKYKSTHWSLERLPEHVKIPAPKDQASKHWIRNPIDAFVVDRLTSIPQTPSEIADLGILVRRASLALTGRLPSVEEMRTVLYSPDPSAYENYVDQLLASPHFGERTATDWLDLARYADTHGYQADRYREVWPYRDWVVSAINQDLPMDQFLTWQLAGDMLPAPTDEQQLATAFNRLHRQNEEGGSTEEEFRVENMTDRVNTLGTAVLGLTLQCTRCHDHKYDPITQKEYYQLCDMFDNIDECGLTSHWTDSMPGPTMLLLDPAKKEQVQALHQAIASVRQAYADEQAKLVRSPQLEQWYESLDAWPLPEDSWLTDEFAFEPPKDTSSNSLANRIAADRPGQSQGPIDWNRDNGRSAIRLDGDNALVFPKVAAFSRTQEFTISLDLYVPKEVDRAVVLHRSRSWTDAGSRGYELLIEDGHFSFGLIHYWPSSAIRIRCQEPVSLGRWQQVTLVYGGTNSAADTHIYIDGRRAKVDVIQDSLHKDILYERVDVSLNVGARDRDRGLPGGMVDNLQIYNVALSPIEIAGLVLDEPRLPWGELNEEQRALWREHYALRIDPQCKYHLESLHHYVNSLAAQTQNAPEMMIMKEKSINRPTRFLNRGAYDAPGDWMEPGVPSKLLREGETLPKNRLELARWLTSNDHPLTARVAANHLWQQMFGRGLVLTSEDFGIQGQPPTHPELLDYLARDLIRSGWSRKAILRKIALSHTFMQSSVVNRERWQVDPDASLYTRYPAQRMTAEQMRDTVLQASGLLSDRLGGPPVHPYQPAGLWEEKSGLQYPQSKGEGLFRSSLYTVWKRTSPPPSMMIFDSAGREVCSARREVTVTSLQALVLMNDPQYVEASKALAFRALGIQNSSQLTEDRFEPGNLKQSLRNTYFFLTSRKCPDALADRLMKSLNEQIAIFEAQPEHAAKLLSVGEWRGIETPNPKLQIQVAALTLILNSMLNSDGFAVVR